MFGLGMSEIIFLAVLALIVIGPKELPEVARTLGRFLNELKRSSNVFTEDLKKQARIDLLDLDAPLRPRKPTVAEELQTPGEEPTQSGMKFDIKPEPHQLEFGDPQPDENSNSKNQGNKPS